MKAVVVGCGISGITSAILLKEKGYDVKILDSRKHIGGNCKIISKYEDLSGISKLIIPGVGSFDHAMGGIEKNSLK